MLATGQVYTPDFVYRFNIEDDYLVRWDLCTAENSATLAEAYCAWFSSLADSPISPTRPLRTLRKFADELLSTPFHVLMDKYDSLFDQIVRSPTIYGAGSLTGEFLEGMKETPIYWDYLHYLRDGCHEVYQYILTFLKFLRKIEYRDESLEPRALRAWLDVEKKLQNTQFPRDICADLRVIMRHLTWGYTDTGVVPAFKHGPGTVADTGRSPLEKAQATYNDPGLLRMVRRYGLTHYALHGLRVEKEFGAANWSEFLTAHKSRNTRRSINRESTQFMYSQQFIAANIIECMDSGLAGKFVTLKDQKHNQDAALFGSYSGELDTIDLSWASDSVSVRLVKRVFTDKLLSDLISCRSDGTELPDGKIFKMDKYAPMGSALCFPVQCLVYLSVVIRAYLLFNCGGDAAYVHRLLGDLEYEHELFTRIILRNMSFDRKVGSIKLHAPRVYGDDIVCDFRVTDDVVLTLETLGFTVNRGKSFTSSQAVRESCGIYCWNGFDVTPLYWSSSVEDFETIGARSLSDWDRALVSLVAGANKFHRHGYFNAAASIRNSAQNRAVARFGTPSIPYGMKTGLSFNVLDIRGIKNDWIESRRNANLHRFEGRWPTLITEEVEGTNEEYEDQRYILWWTSSSRVEWSIDGKSTISITSGADGRPVLRKRGLAGVSVLRWVWQPI